MTAYPGWLQVIAWISLASCGLCTIWIAIDEIRHPQKMWIMNLVWPVSGLYLGPIAIWLYRRTRGEMTGASHSHNKGQTRGTASPDRIQTAVATLHCGAGCTLGDLIGEALVAGLAIGFAGAFGSKLIVDFCFAYLLGILFQYFTIVPMRGLSFGQGLIAALRADTISISLFQVGMFVWMALVYFVFFTTPHLKSSQAVFWFMMQIAMVAGFFASYPANAWLVRKGWKEKMPERSEDSGDHAALRVA